MTDFAAMRRSMVESQLRTNNVVSPAVLDAFAAVPREQFVPERLRSAAYADEDVTLPQGGFILQPLTLARMLQAAAPAPADRALIIGDRSGYTTALLKSMGIRSIVEVPDGFHPASIRRDSYTLIIINGAAAAVPDLLLESLENGGRLVVVLNANPRAMGNIVLHTSNDRGDLSHTTIAQASAPYVDGLQPQPGFAFP